jgi:TAG lipase / steryl ester hydrolase / phospholipase A2 / LPA acyltransferase
MLIIQALTLSEWEKASAELDILENNNVWKKEAELPDYNAGEVREHINTLRAAHVNGDIRRMLYLVRTTWSRDMARMSNLKLYQYSHIGTKELVEDYIRVAIETLKTLVEASDKRSVQGVNIADIYNDLLSTRQSFGRSALLLSGGGTFGMNHIGVLKALWEVKLLPRIISGASAGSIVAATLCSRTDDEIPELLKTFCFGDLAVFNAPDEEDSWLKTLARLFMQGSMFNIDHLTRVMKGMLGNLTFLEAYNRTRRILNICVSSASVYELPKLLNYVTSPHVMIWSAVAASCSVPLVFSPASLLVKDPRTGEIRPWTGNLSQQKWIDGSVDNDLPMQRLSEMFNVNHFIVSQVNPHVVPFLIKDKDINLEEDRHSSFTPGPSWFHGLSTFAKTEVIHRMTMLADAGFLPNVLSKTASVLSQTYSGDITILPEISYIDFPRVLSNPTSDYMLDSMLRGERATWPKLSRIRNHCAIELALDNALNEVRARTVFSESEARIRRQMFKRTQSDDGTQRRSQEISSKPRQRKLSQTSDPGVDTFSIARKGRSSSLLESHKKSNSTQISNIITQSVAARNARHLEAELGLTHPIEDILSPGPGLTSDDGADISSLSSCGEETPVEDPEQTPIATTYKSNPFTSASLPMSPTGIYHRSPFFFQMASEEQSPQQPISPTLHPEASNQSDADSKMSSQEEQYRRIFHGGPKDFVPSARILFSNPSTQSQSSNSTRSRFRDALKFSPSSKSATNARPTS